MVYPISFFPLRKDQKVDIMRYWLIENCGGQSLWANAPKEAIYRTVANYYPFGLRNFVLNHIKGM